MLFSCGVITTGGLSAGVIDFDTDPATKIVLGFLMIFVLKSLQLSTFSYPD